MLSLGVILGIGATATFAAWTDGVTVTGTSVRAATVDLKVQTQDTVTNFTALNTSISPGGSTAGVMTVRNNGTVPLTYYVDANATNADGKGLASSLVVTVTSASAVSGSFPNRTCSGAALANTAAAFTTAFVGSPASPRTLAAASQETLCIQANLPSGTPMTMQTASTSVGFTFTAATNPATSWNDAVSVSGTTISTPTVTTPTISCGANNNIQVAINWPALTGATGYRIYYGTDATTVEDLPSSTTSFPFKGPTSGTTYLQALYGTWTSGNSNTLTYAHPGNASGTCG